VKIYTVGTGGVGGYFGGMLAKARDDVTFVCRGEQYKAVKANGLLVKSVAGDFTVKPAQVVEHISDISHPDLILFSVKTYDTETVAKELSSVVKKDTIIITFQNGVENDLRIKEQIKSDNIFPGVAYVISARTQPGVISQTGGLRKLIFGNRDRIHNPKLKDVELRMKKAGIDAVYSDDITRDLWKKFMFIVAFSGMTAVCKKPIGSVLSHKETEELYEICVREAIEVAKANSIRIEENAFESIMTISRNTAPESKSSLLLDIENNRRNEIETLNGALIQIANRVKIDVPMNTFIYGVMKASSA
jgi:2-dehydropantoate 2-reductase